MSSKDNIKAEEGLIEQLINDRYRIEALLGRGNVGVVYRAVVLVEVTVVPMRHPLGEGMTWLTDVVSGKDALAGDDGGRGVGRGPDA